MENKLRRIQNKEPAKLRRPNYLPDDVRATASFDTQPKHGDGKLMLPSPGIGIPDPDNGEGDDKDKAASLKSMLDTLRDLEKYMPLEDVTAPMPDNGEPEQTPGDLLGIDPPPRGKYEFRSMSTRAAADVTLKQVALELTSTSKVEMEQALLKIQRGLILDMGDSASNQTVILLINSIVRLERLEHTVFNVCAKVGLLKINRRSRSVQIQGAIKDALLPTIQAKRMLVQTLDSLKKQGSQTRRMSMTFDGDAFNTEEEAWGAANEMHMILTGQQLKPLGALKKMTLEQTEMIKK